MEEIITKISAWTAPPLLGAVIWFLVKKFEDLDKSIDHIKAVSNAQTNKLEDKLDRVDDKLSLQVRDLQGDLVKTHQAIVNVQGLMTKEIQEIGKAVVEMKVTTSEVKRWLEDSRIHHGRIIHIDSTVQRHEQILISSAKVMKNHNERISKTEADIIHLKDMKKGSGENEGA